MDHSRRKLLMRSLALGCSAAASPLITPVTFASVPSDNRLVVIILRGAMDGLDVVRPVGDSDYMRHRSGMGRDHSDLNGMFALHSGLNSMMPMWRDGSLGFAHAVSTPYRDKRSHFDGQDLLEAGYADPSERDAKGSGWLNRMLTLMPNVHAETAFAVGQEDLILLKGDAAHSSWSPGRSLLLSAQGQSFLEHIYEADPLFHASAETALQLSAEVLGSEGMDEDEMMMQMQENLQAARLADRAKALAKFSAEQLQQDTRIAAFSIGGWDTHRKQGNAIKPALGQLSDALLTLQNDLGPLWKKTAVLCMTEFGRTVRQNGSFGTDHGTGGAMIMAGGAIQGGDVYGKWPKLGEGDLYQDRDLMPTADVRSYAAYVMRGLFGTSKGDLENVVFPGLDIGVDPKVIL